MKAGLEDFCGTAAGQTYHAMFIMQRICLVLVVLLSGIATWSDATSQVLSGCGQPIERVQASRSAATVSKRVVGGVPTTTRAFPWTVVIKRFGHSGVVCTGAILSRRLVLTAAHCFDTVNEKDTYLWVGKDHLDYSSSHQQVYYVQRVVLHSLYNTTTKNNDIALIETIDSMYFNSNVRPVCLPDPNTVLAPSTPCLLAGYGDTLGTGEERRLNYVQVPMVSSSLCAQGDWLGTDFQIVMAVSFCAGHADGGPDACSGDSGAALVCPHPSTHSYYVYGVASWGKGCGERRKPGVYTLVPAFLHWITANFSSSLPQH